MSLQEPQISARDFFAEAPFHRFRDFIKPQSDRFSLLNAILMEFGFHYSVVKFGDSRHFFVSSPLKEKPESALVAHYDTVCGSPGANDNASSVFILLSAALELKKNASFPWMIIFTDNEELGAEKGLRAQGAYRLAAGLKNTALSGADFFVFDSCGRGNTLIISTAADILLKKETSESAAETQKKLIELRQNALFAAEHSTSHNFMLLPTPFSDDAGFLLAGLAAQMITVLPQNEAADFAQITRANINYTRALLSREGQEKVNMNLIPETWRLLNGPEDGEETLNPEYFSGTLSFALSLASGGRLGQQLRQRLPSSS